MNVNAGHRLKTWRTGLGMSQRDLAAQIGRSQGFIGDIETGRSEFSRGMLQLLSERYSVNPDWLLYGRGDMLHASQPGFSTGHGTRIEPPNYAEPAHGDFVFENTNFVMIRRYDVNLSAGVGLIPTEDNELEGMAFPRSWLGKNQINAQLSGLVQVRGESMMPTIPDGSLVLVHMAERLVEHEGIYAFSRDGAVYVKRLIPIGGKSGGGFETILIVSDNPAMPSEALQGNEIGEINIAGRVRCVLFSV